MSENIFVGRQPIFDRHREVFGYELLYRSNGQSTAFDTRDGDQASRQVIDRSLNVITMDELVGERRAFINITRTLLVDHTYTVLPPNRAVVELLETVEPDEQVVGACRVLKDSGYMLALDDFVFRPEYRPLLDCADILKIDFMDSDGERRREIAQDFGGKRLMLLAEKVETHEDFEQAVRLGYRYFQGYFFCKPQLVAGRQIPAFKRNLVLFMHEINRPDIDYERLEQVIKRELSLSSKLLRYLNSAALGVRQRITSIRHALTLLGERPLRRWATLAAMSAIADDKPQELLSTSLVRARFAELLGPRVGIDDRDLDLFLMGMFSVMDALTDQPLEEVVAQMPLAPDVTAALLGSDSTLGQVRALTLSFERGNETIIAMHCRNLGVAPQTVSDLYRQAIVWATQTMI